MGVHDKSSIAEETDQGKPASTRHLHCEARRRRYGCENRHAGDERLLHNLESPATAHKKKPFRQRQASSKKGIADRFVYGVVSADILTHKHEPPVRIEQAGCV
jgi:hypothetical protein